MLLHSIASTFILMHRVSYESFYSLRPHYTFVKVILNTWRSGLIPSSWAIPT